MNPVQFFKCLSEETRLHALLLIQLEGELCVCELMAALEEIQPKVSRHLAQLRQCGVLQDRRQGQWVFYRIHPDLPEWAKASLQIAAEGNRTYLEGCFQRLVQMGGRPERIEVCCSE